MNDPNTLRRVDDRRLDGFERTLDEMADTINQIRDMLISEPEASPLGRALLRRANDNQAAIRETAETNRAAIRDLADRVNSLESWRDQATGAYNAGRIIQVLIGVVVGLLTINNLMQLIGK